MKLKTVLTVFSALIIIGLSITAILTFAPGEEQTTPQTPPAEEPPLERTRLPRIYVQGSDILDENGNKVVFHGVNSIGVGELIYYEEKWNEEYFEKMSEWNVRIVRLPIHYASYWWNEQQNPGSFLRMLDQGIEWAAKHHIYSIIDFHSCGWPPTGEYFGGEYDHNWHRNIYEFTPEELKDFWDTVSRYFAGDTRIAFFDLFNEPAKENPNTGGVGDDISVEAWLEWRDFAEGLIDIIRANDPERAVLVGGLQFGYNIMHTANYPIRRENVVYSVHVYKNTDWMTSWDVAFGNLAGRVPILLGEVGFDPNDPRNPATVEDFARPFIDYLDSKNIGWVAWIFGPVWGPSLISDWEGTPTEAGAFFKERLSRY